MLKRVLFFLFTLTLFCGTSVLLCISNYNPFRSQYAEFIQFYLSVFGTIVGLASLLVFFAKYRFHKDKSSHTYIWSSIRQGVFVALYLTLVLFLQGMRLLDSWTIFPLAIVLILLELFFQTKRKDVMKLRGKV